jgi:hypothetical protein
MTSDARYYSSPAHGEEGGKLARPNRGALVEL